MGKYEFAKTEAKDKILIVTINRPEVYNAVHPPLSRELDAVSYTHLTLPTKRIV